jgi:hypothetical protein
MKKKFISFLAFLLFIAFYLSAQSRFEIRLDTDEDEWIYKGSQHPAGSYFFTGRQGFGFQTSSPYIIRVSQNGAIKDTVIVREDTNGFFPTFEFLDNGNILFIGQCKLQDTLTKFDYLWLCEMDTNLNIIKEEIFYMLKDNYYEYYSWYSLIDSSGTIIVTGNYKYYPGHHDMIYSKISQNLDTLMTKSYYFQFTQFTGQIFLQPDGHYLSIVERIYLTHPLSLVELDTNLDIINISQTAIEYNSYQGTTISWLNDSINFQSASRYDYSTESWQIGVSVHDRNFQIVDEIVIDRPDTMDFPNYSISHSYINDSTIYVCGFQSYSDFYVLTPSAIFLYLFDKDLNILGHLDLGGDVNYEMWGVTASNDDGCLIYGTTYDNPYGINEYDVYIRKIAREEINLVTEIGENPLFQNSVEVYPIPVNDILTVELDKSNEKSSISIFNVSGQLVHQNLIRGGRNIIDISHLTAGFYFYQIRLNNQETESGKFIKL